MGNFWHQEPRLTGERILDTIQYTPIHKKYLLAETGRIYFLTFRTMKSENIIRNKRFRSKKL